jgi:tyrosyl-tRNA synthetase
MNLFDELKWRGMLKDISNEEEAKKMLNDEKMVFYIGFDPSADSLTIGNFVQIIRIKLIQNHGHQPIILVGGATGLIGDPKETEERKLLTLETSLNNAKKIEAQLKRYLSFDGDNKAIVVNNYDWISKINTIEFLRDYGKYFNINYMLSKETVSKRLETGISYTEFSYMILQALDWLHLYKTYNCTVQFGGSDQWGNITAGLELIRKKEDNARVVALSSPLLLKADGTKFGKSEKGSLWLDEEKTSPYELYQYFYNSADADVITYLKLLTLFEKDEIDRLETSLKESPEKREAQKALAYEVVRFIHGEEEALKAKETSEKVFSNGGIDENMPTVKANRNIIEKGINITDLLTDTKITSSKSEARRLIEQNGISMNQDKVTDINKIINLDDFKDNSIIIQKGKKSFTKIDIE